MTQKLFDLDKLYLGSIWWKTDFLEIRPRALEHLFLGLYDPKLRFSPSIW